MDLGLASLSSSVQRSFFCGDVIAITSWAPDVVNLVRPMWEDVRHTETACELHTALPAMANRVIRSKVKQVDG